METLIDGQWYRVPFADAQASGLVAYGINKNSSGKKQQFNLTSNFGVIPPGRYRIIKKFTDDATSMEEYALAAFTISDE